MVLYHISLNSAMKPLLLYLPRSLEAEEQALLNSHDRLLDHDGAYGNTAGAANGMESKTFMEKTATDKGTPAPIQGLIPQEVLQTSIFTATTLRCGNLSHMTLPTSDIHPKSSVMHINILLSPISCPLLWVPRDPMGVSRQEVNHTNQVTPMTDEGAYFTEERQTGMGSRRYGRARTDTRG